MKAPKNPEIFFFLYSLFFVYCLLKAFCYILWMFFYEVVHSLLFTLKVIVFMLVWIWSKWSKEINSYWYNRKRLDAFCGRLFRSVFTARHQEWHSSFKAFDVYLIPDIVYILSHSAGLWRGGRCRGLGGSCIAYSVCLRC